MTLLSASGFGRTAAAVALGALLAVPLAAQGNPRPVWPDEGPKTWAPRPTEAAITANDLRTRLYQFADDSMMGRRIGELGNFKGTAYIAREFARLGLKPAGDSGTYFQNMPYGPMGYDVTASTLTARGTRLMRGSDWVPLVPNEGNAIGGHAALSGVPVIFAGRWGDTSVTLDPATFRGKVAVFTGGPVGGRGGRRGGRGAGPLPRCDSLPDNFGAAAAIALEQAGGGRRRGGRGGLGGARDTRARDAGVAAMLFVDGDMLPENLVTSAFAERMGMRPAEVEGAPAAAVTNGAAARLFGKSVSDLQVGAAGRAVSASWQYTWRMSPTPARNVVAILPGSDPARAGEFVLVGAHNDHVGINGTVVDHDSLRAVNIVTRRQGANDPACRPSPGQQHEIDSLIARAHSIRPPRRDSIMNGADDDGSGTVVLLEIAEKFATEKPARSIIFVSHEGEEAGLLGSKWFTDHPTIPLDSIVAAHNMDMVGKGRVEQVKFGGPASIQILGARRLSREFGDVIDSLNAVRSEVMAIDKTWDVPANPLNRFCRSDQVNYVHHNIPVTYFSLGYAEDYHQQTDEPQYVDYDHAARVGRFVHDIMLAIADRKDRLKITGPDQDYPQCR